MWKCLKKLFLSYSWTVYYAPSSPPITNVQRGRGWQEINLRDIDWNSEETTPKHRRFFYLFHAICCWFWTLSMVSNYASFFTKPSILSQHLCPSLANLYSCQLLWIASFGRMDLTKLISKISDLSQGERGGSESRWENVRFFASTFSEIRLYICFLPHTLSLHAPWGPELEKLLSWAQWTQKILPLNGLHGLQNSMHCTTKRFYMVLYSRYFKDIS